MNPSVTIDGGTRHVDPALDPFDEKNGFNPNGPSHYAKAFQDRYFAAQATRMNALIDRALAIQARIGKGDYPYPDDDILLVPSGGNPGAGAGGDAKLATLDPAIADLQSTARPEKLLRNDGTIVTQIVRSVAVAEPGMAKTNRGFDTGTKIFTLKSFLSANATRATNANGGIDYCSMGGYQFIRDDEIIFDKSASRDKDYFVLEGAVHGFTPCTACETTPGQYSNSVKNLFDYIRNWTNKRF